MNLREQVAVAHEASALLENETMKQAFREAESKIISEWINSQEDDHWSRETAYYRLHALYSVQKELKIFLDNGSIAARILEKEK